MGILVALIGVAIIAAVVVASSLPFSEVSSEENWKTKKNKKGGCEKFNRVFTATFLLFFKCFF